MRRTTPARVTPARAALAALGTAALLIPLAAGAAATTGEQAGQDERDARLAQGAPRPAKEHRAFLSRPDLAGEAPALSTIRTGKEDPRPLLTDPGPDSTGGIGIYDNNGDLVWWQDGTYANLNATTYKGQPVLSAYKGSSDQGSYVLLDSAYREIASFAMKGYSTDVHDFQISPDGKRVLLLSYDPVPYDLSEHGGPADASVTDAVIQEQDIETGEVTFEWSALDHIPITETQVALNEKEVDYVHFNSLAYEPDGSLLASARHSSTVYKIDMADGKIDWRLGGEQSDFTLPQLADAHSFQHDARRLKDGSISVFDNGNLANPQVSRGAVYKLDEEKKTATLTRDLQPNPPQYGSFVGSSNEMANGNQLVSYGNTGEMAEFQGEEPVWAGAFPEGYFSYRAQRADWKGTPAKAPDVKLHDGKAAVSWNGATDVARWRVSAEGETHTVKKDGFETRVPLPENAEGADRIRVSALDERGDVLRVRTVRASGG